VTRCYPPHPALSPTGGEDTGEGAYTSNRSITFAILNRTLVSFICIPKAGFFILRAG
jgi:hypothetical protein